MTFKISKDLFIYLNQELQQEKPDLLVRMKLYEKNDFVGLEMDEDVATEVRDWACEKLEKKGFDKNYGLTVEGKILEDLIDIFFV
jgi:hypothetical protein